jgi:hypothetical protein
MTKPVRVVHHCEPPQERLAAVDDLYADARPFPVRIANDACIGVCLREAEILKRFTLPYEEPNPEPRTSRLPRCSQAAGDCIDANEQIDQKTFSRFVILGRESRTPVPQQSDLLRMKRQ